MRSRILALLASVMLFGCTAERYFVGDGVEALVYQENHRFEFTVKQPASVKSQLVQLVQAAEKQNATAHYSIVYRTKGMKQLAKDAMKRFPELTLNNHRVDYKYRAKEEADLVVNITLHKVKAESCKPSQVMLETYKRNCFVESSRMQQVVNKNRLVGE
ncbi:hypothetical protein ACNUDM_07890 [Vibrio chaetopteri]|uniref:hypothetical protein n=1 Tax=Vibrio chaetopteri TaxID=3016528 RepID=UPI003AB8704B